MRATLTLLAVLFLGAFASASETQVQFLSGTGPGDAVPWDFFCTNGRQSREWTTIPVPSCWEQQGFGTYNFGGELNGAISGIGNEQGLYRRTFTVPDAWRDRVVKLVFEGSMTDTTVWINGELVGPTHQGGFYRFSYEVSRFLKFGVPNQIEVTVAKNSSNRSVNAAERESDYWVFGGIYRPVRLEAYPKTFIDRTAIDAGHDGRIRAEVSVAGDAVSGTEVVARVTDLDDRPIGDVLRTVIAPGETVAKLQGNFSGVSPWTAETPSLYRLHVSLGGNGHETIERFGFRTIEVRPQDGIYVNGVKIKLRGTNRHSFWPETGRTLDPEHSYRDVRLIKGANMNAVRLSHYPPDVHFLDACDELGLYALDELAGWQKAYNTTAGRPLVGEMIRRDENHPSILFWDNGNEGGWNTALDAEFARWDIQKRTVLHPWANFGGIDTDHYEKFASTANKSAGPTLFMPTEFLHGLYDGGNGTGLRDYWNVMGPSPFVVGGFLWAFIDEGIARTDRGGRIDNMGDQAPDGLMGPHREKKGSYDAVREIWSPIQVVAETRDVYSFRAWRVHNQYDFTNLKDCRIQWSIVAVDPRSGKRRRLVKGDIVAPDVAPHEFGTLTQKKAPALPKARPGEERIFFLEATDPTGMSVWTWSAPFSPSVPLTAPVDAVTIAEVGPLVEMRSKRVTVRFDKSTGMLAAVTALGKPFALSNGPRVVAMVQEVRELRDLTIAPKVASWAAKRDAKGTHLEFRYASGLKSAVWTLRADGSLVLDYSYQEDRAVDLLGIRFDYPEGDVVGKQWLGRGPYRVYRNRQEGGVFDLWASSYNDPVPGETYAFPEFKGTFGDWHWLTLETKEGRIGIENLGATPFHGLYQPKAGARWPNAIPDFGLSFLDVIPAQGTKFDAPADLGPQSESVKGNGVYRGQLRFEFLSSAAKSE